MRLPADIVQRIHQTAHITEVVGDFVQLKKSGKDYKACCPFHNERSPSFFVSPAKNIYKCFGCGKGGDPVAFIMEIEGVSYGHALRYLAEKYQIPLPVQEEKITDQELQDQNDKESVLIALEFAKKYFQEQLLYTDEGKAIGMSYLKQRGFQEHIIKTFELGFSYEEWDNFFRNALKKGYRPEILEKAGLVIKKENKEEYFDRFRDRVIFPIHSVSGRIIGFGGRALKNDKSVAKYINSPETLVYQKSHVLYGLFHAKKAILQKDVCYLVEGYADVISLHQSGIENTVASSGTSLTTEQIRLIRRFTHHITILYDGDTAGLKAALRGVDIVLEEGLQVKIVILPENEDPDSYLQKIGTNAFETFLKENAQDFIAFKTRLLLKDAQNDPFRRGEALRDIVTSISKIPDVLQRNIFFKECSRLFGMDEATLISEGNKIKLLEAKKSQADQDLPFLELDNPTATLTTDPVYFQEQESIRLLLSYANYPIENDRTFGHYLLEEIEGIEFSTPIFEQILAIFKAELTQGHLIDAQYFLQTYPENTELQQAVIDLITSRHQPSPEWGKHEIYVPQKDEKMHVVAFRHILKLKWHVVQKMLKDTKLQIATAQTPQEQEDALKVHMQLKEIEKQIAKDLGNVVR